MYTLYLLAGDFFIRSATAALLHSLLLACPHSTLMNGAKGPSLSPPPKFDRPFSRPAAPRSAETGSHGPIAIYTPKMTPDRVSERLEINYFGGCWRGS